MEGSIIVTKELTKRFGLNIDLVSMFQKVKRGEKRESR